MSSSLTEVREYIYPTQPGYRKSLFSSGVKGAESNRSVSSPWRDSSSEGGVLLVVPEEGMRRHPTGVAPPSATFLLKSTGGLDWDGRSVPRLVRRRETATLCTLEEKNQTTQRG